MIEKITQSALAMREFIALFVVCFLVMAGTYWIAFVWWPVEVKFKDEMIQILRTSNERLTALEKILERKP